MNLTEQINRFASAIIDAAREQGEDSEHCEAVMLHASAVLAGEIEAMIDAKIAAALGKV